MVKAGSRRNAIKAVLLGPLLGPLFSSLLSPLLSPSLAAVLATALAACKKAPTFDNFDITGAKGFNTAFRLPDIHGQTRSLADFHGKVVVLFFGYTQCPDVCPTSLAELAEARQRLGRDGDRLQVVFVTVDPQRDTIPILAEYVKAFDPSFEALRPADDAAVASLTKGYHIYVAKQPVPGATKATDYTVDHTAASYVFDTNGTLRLFAKDGEGVDRWVHDVRLLLQETAS